MICPHCKKEMEISKIHFRSECPFCETNLHSCRFCKYFSPGKPNDCMILNTDPIYDRDKYNFCEEFSFKNSMEQAHKSKNEIEKSLFDDLDKLDDDDDFSSLFKD
ncbi:MAG TPA: hypothetical protein P5048_04020 [Chlamydiales bacterium]|nr:hypothetical protein [Chlamydiales bacterium]